MPVRRKPKPLPSLKTSLDAAIARGGSVAHNIPPSAKRSPQLVQLRLQPHDIARIDAVRKTRLVSPSRHAWLLEAIFEKLQREETEQLNNPTKQ